MRFTITTTSLLLAAVSTASASVMRRGNNFQNVLYWGGNYVDKPLAGYCQKDTADTVVLAFITDFGHGSYPKAQFGKCTVNADKTFSKECADVAKDIQTCKDKGIKVLLSIGGANANNAWSLSDTADAQKAADALWNSYAAPGASSGFPRPFGNVFVDGWDVDLESQGKDGTQATSHKMLSTMLGALRKNFGKDTKNTYYLGGAPQCGWMDGNIGQSIMDVQYDFLWTQYYNNPNCAANNVFKKAYGTSKFNMAEWSANIGAGASKNAKLFVGLPANDAVGHTYVIDPKDLDALFAEAKKVKGFAGAMVYDAMASDDTNVGGKNYAQLVKAALNKL